MKKKPINLNKEEIDEEVFLKEKNKETTREKEPLNMDKEEEEEKKDEKKPLPFGPDKIEQFLSNSLKYKEALNLPKKWAENEAFKLGDQWAPATEKTKTFPRPVLNFCGYIVDHKTSNISAENVKIVYTSKGGDQTLGQDFTRFSETEYERLKIDDLNLDILDEAAIKGIGIAYYYIEPSLIGQVKLEREVIDPVNFHCSNPKQTDIQKQAWNIVVQRLPIEEVKELAIANEIEVDLEADKEILGSEYANKNIDIDGIEKVNLINFFYKAKDGEIHLIRCVGNKQISQDLNLQIKKYPFVCLQWVKKTEDFYSKGEIDFLKANQRQVNTLLALQLMNQQLVGFPKMWTKKGALNPNSVKGNIGEILVDNSQSQGLNFGWLQPAPVNQFATTLQDNLINHSKALNGAHDTQTGMARADNASAILALQKQGATALSKIKKKYYQYIEDTALLWLEFFCNHYIIDREYTYTDALGNETTAVFNGEGVDISMLNVKIDVGVSSLYSEEYEITSLDKFLQMGLIDFKTYLKYVPNNVVPFKESLLKEIQAKEEQAQQEAKEYLLSQLNPQELELFNSLQPEQQDKFLLDMAKEEEQAGLQEQQQTGYVPQQG